MSCESYDKWERIIAQTQAQPQQPQGPLERAYSTRSLAAPVSGAALGDVHYKQAVHTDQLRTLVERERRAEEAAAGKSLSSPNRSPGAAVRSAGTLPLQAHVSIAAPPPPNASALTRVWRCVYTNYITSESFSWLTDQRSVLLRDG